MKHLLLILLMLSIGTLSVTAQTQIETPTTTYELPAKKRAIKMGLFAPLGNKLIFGYEQWIKQKITFEAKVGIIGVGFATFVDTDPRGAFVKFGPKFLAGQDFYIPGMKDVHPLRGTYFKPEIAISSFSRNIINGTNERVTDLSAALLINFGKQWVLADIITIDGHIGLGYGWSSQGDSDILAGDDYFPNKYSNVQAGNSFPIAATSGITIGILLK